MGTVSVWESPHCGSKQVCSLPPVSLFQSGLCLITKAYQVASVRVNTLSGSISFTTSPCLGSKGVTQTVSGKGSKLCRLKEKPSRHLRGGLLLAWPLVCCRVWC